MRLQGHTQKHNGGIIMAFIYNTFTNQGGTTGCTEIVEWMTSNFPGMFDSYAISGSDVICKIGDTSRIVLNNTLSSGSFPSGYRVDVEAQSHSFASGNQKAFAGVVADVDTQVVVFLSGGGGYPIISLCKNEDGDTCAVGFITGSGNNILVGISGTIGLIQQSKVYVYNLTQNTYHTIPCGFAHTEQNAVCGYPLLDAGCKKIQNLWVGGCSSLRGLLNPIEISVDNVIYCSINYGWLLIK